MSIRKLASTLIIVLLTVAANPIAIGQQNDEEPNKATIGHEKPNAPKDYSIEDLYSELLRRHNAVQDDPFDPNKKKADRAAIYAELAEREFLIPNPTPGSKWANFTPGGKQGIWPLFFVDGKLYFDFNTAESPITDNKGLMTESALNYWKTFEESRRIDIRTRDGERCDTYRSYNTYGISPAPVSRGHFQMPVADNVTKSWQYNFIRISGDFDVDRARNLSGKTATYVRMKSIDIFGRIHAHEGGFKYRESYCWEGTNAFILGRVASIRVVNKITQQDLVNITFTEWK